MQFPAAMAMIGEASAGFVTMPLTKQPLMSLEERQQLKHAHSAKVRVSATGGPAIVVINDYQDSQYYGTLQLACGL